MPDGAATPAETETQLNDAADKQLDTTVPAGGEQLQDGDEQQQEQQGELDEMAMFRFTDADADGEQQQAAEGEQQEGEGDAVPDGWALDEKCGIPAEMHADLGKLVAKRGIDGAAAAGLLQDAMEYARQKQLEGHREVAAQMREKWGNQFDARLSATKTFWAKFAREAGIPMENMEWAMTPYGMMIGDTLREYCGDAGKLPGRTPVPHSPTNQERLDEIYNTPALYEALCNPSHADYAKINAEVNRLLGISKK